MTCPSLSDGVRAGQASPVKDKPRIPDGTGREEVHFFFPSEVAKRVGCKSKLLVSSLYETFFFP